VATITGIENMWLATIVAGLATFGHQAMSANMFTMVSDLFPKRAVASVVGLGSAAGSAAAFAFSYFVGQRLQHTHSYTLMFVIAGVGYPLTWVFLHLMAPHWTPVAVGGAEPSGFPVIGAEPATESDATGKWCERCGKLMTPKAGFCPNCGSRM
jgi:ACS family hexuronate transporter-like MFS transporter